MEQKLNAMRETELRDKGTLYKVDEENRQLKRLNAEMLEKIEKLNRELEAGRSRERAQVEKVKK